VRILLHPLGFYTRSYRHPYKSWEEVVKSYLKLTNCVRVCCWVVVLVFLINKNEGMEATYAYDFFTRVTRGMKARSNFRYLNSEHCIQSNPPPVSLNGTTFPTNIRGPIPLFKGRFL